jgi:hypothetical protein
MNEQAAQRAEQLQAAGTPIFDRLVLEGQGQQRPEGVQAASPAGDDQAATGDAANKPEGQGQAAAASELPADMQKIQDLQRGHPSATGAVQRLDGPLAASPHAGATSGEHHRTPSKGSGGHSRGTSRRSPGHCRRGSPR